MVCLVLALLVVERSVRDALLWTSPVPYFDLGSLIQFTNEWLTHTLPLGFLWYWHNDHLIPAPQLIYLADIIFFRNSAVVLVLCSWTLLLVQVIVMLYFTWRNLNLKFALFGSAIVIASGFSPSQMENLTWGFQLAYWMGQVFGILAIVFLIRSLRSRSPWLYSALSVLYGIIAALSFGGGVMIWPCVIALVLKLPLSVRQKALHISCGVFIFVALLWARMVQFPAGVTKRPSLAECWGFFTAALGMTWSSDRSSVSVIVTVVSLFVFALLLGRFLRSESPSDLSILATGGALFSLLWVFAVTFGRASYGVKFAASERYQTTVLCFFACLALGLLEWSFHSQWPIIQAVAVVFGGTILAAVPTIHGVEAGTRSGAQYLQRAEAAIKVGVGDASVISGNLILGPKTLRDLGLSRRYDYSLFADREHRLLGQHLDQSFQLQSACPGKILQQSDIDGRYPGRYLSGEKGKGGHQIVVVSKGVIVGLGFEQIQGPHAWAAFARRSAGPLEVYAVSRHEACLVATAGAD